MLIAIDRGQFKARTLRAEYEKTMELGFVYERQVNVAALGEAGQHKHVQLWDLATHADIKHYAQHHFELFKYMASTLEARIVRLCPRCDGKYYYHRTHTIITIIC